jgi:hypothetical protein
MAPLDDNDRGKLAVAGTGLLAALLLATWLLGFFDRDDSTSGDPKVADILRGMEQPEKADVKLLKEKYMQLTPEQQKEVGMHKMLMSMPKQEQELNDFFAQSEEEQWKQVDREIDAQEAKQQQAAGDSWGRGGGKSASSPTNPQQVMSMKQEWTANASPELRSMMERRFRMLNQRREQRGLGPL